MNQSNITPPKPPKIKKREDHFVSTCISVGVILVVLSSIMFGFVGSFLFDQFQNKQGITVIQNNTVTNGKIKNIDVSDTANQCRTSVVEITTETPTNKNGLFQPSVLQGTGSGVIISADGYIVTNYHVIHNASNITVYTANGKTYEGKLIGSDSQTDLAVIKINAKKLRPSPIGNSNKLKVGDAAIAIGNPLGSLGGTVTTGIISALNREITIEGETMTLLQTDAAINPGNSGGGLFDANGNLIGIVNAKQSATGVEGLGFAIPISDALPILDELIENGHISSRPALNVSLYDLTNSTNPSLENGVYIVQVLPGGAADKSGLKQNDRIISFDEKEIKSSSEIKFILRKHKIGDKISIIIERNGKQIETEITLKAPTILQK